MKRIFQYGFALALAACSFAACSDDDTGENGVKTDVTLSPSDLSDRRELLGQHAQRKQ